MPASEKGIPRRKGLAMPENRRFIFPRNLTARAATAAQKVIGNPVTSRMESGVGNCFPGLEFDVESLILDFFQAWFSST